MSEESSSGCGRSHVANSVFLRKWFDLQVRNNLESIRTYRSSDRSYRQPYIPTVGIMLHYCWRYVYSSSCSMCSYNTVIRVVQNLTSPEDIPSSAHSINDMLFKFPVNQWFQGIWCYNFLISYLHYNRVFWLRYGISQCDSQTSEELLISSCHHRISEFWSFWTYLGYSIWRLLSGAASLPD